MAVYCVEKLAEAWRTHYSVRVLIYHIDTVPTHIICHMTFPCLPRYASEEVYNNKKSRCNWRMQLSAMTVVEFHCQASKILEKSHSPKDCQKRIFRKIDQNIQELYFRKIISQQIFGCEVKFIHQMNDEKYFIEW